MFEIKIVCLEIKINNNNSKKVFYYIRGLFIFYNRFKTLYLVNYVFSSSRYILKYEIKIKKTHSCDLC